MVRIYLGHCLGGNITSLLPQSAEEMRTKPNPLSEVDAWGIFKCLALGILAMDKRIEELCIEFR